MANGVEYYTFGNSDFVYDMLSAVAMMMGGNSGYESLVRATMLLAFMGLLVYGVFKQSMMPVTSWFFAAMLAWYGLFIPKVNVIIVDESNPTYTRVVSNMPLGLAYMGNFTSSIGRWFTQKTEAVFSPIAESRYSETGMVFGTYAYTNLRSLTMIDDDPGLQTDWTQFLENCTRYDTTMYAKASGFTVDEALKSPDLLTLLGKTNVVLPTNVSGTTMYCNEAYANLFGRTKSLTQNTIVKRYAKILNSSIGTQGQSSAAIEAKRLTQAGVAFNDIFNGVRASALETVEQQVMINMVNFASVQGPQITNDLEKMQTAIAASTAQAQMIASENTAFLMASKYLPIIHNVLEGLIIALFPLVLVVMVLAGIDSFSVVVGYMSMLMSIKLWPGLFAIINGIASTKFIYGATAQASSSGLTLSNADTLFSMAHSSQAFAGGMALLVPVIAHFIVSKMKGGLGWASSLAQGVKGTAEKSGAGMGTGDFSVGNGSWNNANANKNDTSWKHTSPNMAVQQTAGNATTSQLTKGGSLGQNGEIVGGTVGPQYFNQTGNNIGIGASSSLTRAMGLSKSAENSEKSAQTATATAEQSYTAGMSDLTSWTGTNASSLTSSKGGGNTLSATNSKAVDSAVRNTEKASQGLSTAEKSAVTSSVFEAGQLTANAGLTGVSAQASLAVGQKLEASHGSEARKAFDQAVDTMNSEGVKFDKGLTDQIMSSKAFQTSYSGGDSYAKGAVANFSSSETAKQSASQSLEQAKSFRAQASDEYGRAFRLDNDNNALKGEAVTQLQQEGAVNVSDGISAKESSKIGDRMAQLMSQSDGGFGSTGGAGTVFDPNGKGGVPGVEGLQERLSNGGLGADTGEAVQAFGESAAKQVNGTGQKNAALVQGSAGELGKTGFRTNLTDKVNNESAKTEEGIKERTGEIDSKAQEITKSGQQIQGSTVAGQGAIANDPGFVAGTVAANVGSKAVGATLGGGPVAGVLAGGYAANDSVNFQKGFGDKMEIPGGDKTQDPKSQASLVDGDPPGEQNNKIPEPRRTVRVPIGQGRGQR